MKSLADARDILVSTFLSLGRNWGAILRIAMVPIGLPLAILALGFLWWAGNAEQLTAETKMAPVLVALVFVPLLILLIGYLSVAVSWHRFEVLNEVKPLWHWDSGGGFVWGYFGRSLLLGLILLLILLVCTIPAFILVDRAADGSFSLEMGEMPTPYTLKNLILSIAVFSLANAFWLKFSLILPAGATGHPGLSLSASLRASEALHFGTYLLLGAVLQILPLFVGELLNGVIGGPISAVLLGPVVIGFWIMFGIAIITTLYMRCIKPTTTPQTRMADGGPGQSEAKETP